ncbi:uncharacterized protein LOC118428019 [Branchiostoma floridae]|uniref:Uncharacterized protein LOC118428019 n=1 Tax=Branchiostoma floridae TaxID=7739 RepID=A0A9J7M3H0_BRAFL|nr:uncharacterized protein LOC118428019 [Branchiostoma floridae]
MATGGFVYNEGIERRVRLQALLIDEGTTLLRKTFDKKVLKVNPQGLKDLLLKKKTQLKNLYEDQKKILYPTATGAVDSSTDFDITLLTNLLRQLCGMTAPASWGKPPKPPVGDTSDVAWIMRLQQFRNKVYGHIARTAMSETEFGQQWDELSKILIGLGGDPNTVSQRKTQPISRDKAQVYLKKVEELHRHLVEETKENIQEHTEVLSHKIDNMGQAILDKMDHKVKDDTSWMAMRPCKFIAVAVVILLISCLIVYPWTKQETSFMDAFPRHMETFVGREDIFSNIDACLAQNKTCLIKGLGGVGKTTVAIEYGHRRSQRYPGGVFWVNLASKGDLCASISQYGSSFSDRADLSCEFVKKHLKKYLKESEHWLLVADGFNGTMKELDSLLPHKLTVTMNILLTSQENQMLDRKPIPVVNIPPFSDNEAQALFNKTVRPYSSKDDRKQLKSLSRSLGNHPLALQLAYAYMRVTECTVKDYHDKFIEGNATDKVKLLDRAKNVQDVDKTIQETFEITFQHISQLPSYAVKLLNMTSFMGPICIPCPEPNNQNFAKLLTTSGTLDRLEVSFIA